MGWLQDSVQICIQSTKEVPGFKAMKKDIHLCSWGDQSREGLGDSTKLLFTESFDIVA